MGLWLALMEREELWGQGWCHARVTPAFAGAVYKHGWLACALLLHGLKLPSQTPHLGPIRTCRWPLLDGIRGAGVHA